MKGGIVEVDRTARRRIAIGPRVRPLAALLALAALGCAASILGSDPDTGLDVAVRKGPLDPVGREGVDNTAPVADAVVRIRPVGDSGHADGSTDAEGLVEFALPAGSYEASVRRCPGTLVLPRADTVQVTTGERTRLTLVCDTGIR